MVHARRSRNLDVDWDGDAYGIGRAQNGLEVQLLMVEGVN